MHVAMLKKSDDVESGSGVSWSHARDAHDARAALRSRRCSLAVAILVVTAVHVAGVKLSNVVTSVPKQSPRPKPPPPHAFDGREYDTYFVGETESDEPTGEDGELHLRRDVAVAAIDRLRRERPAVTEGVVCRTLLSAAVEREFEGAAERAIGIGSGCDDDCSVEFVRLARRLCRWAGEGVAPGYTGLWDLEADPADEDLAVLRALADWLEAAPPAPPPPPRTDWLPTLIGRSGHPCAAPASTFEAEAAAREEAVRAEAREAAGEEAVEEAARAGAGAEEADTVAEAEAEASDPISVGGCFVVDFGCGSGEELKALGAAHALAPSRLVGVDVSAKETGGAYERLVLPSPDNETVYCAALDALAVRLRSQIGADGAAVVMSTVTFHHLPTVSMRACVLGFVAAVMGEAGAFVLREWDNGPGTYEIWFDLLHEWSPGLPADDLPTSPAHLRLAPRTSYDGWGTYSAQAAAAGLEYNDTLQVALHGGVRPRDMLEGEWPARNFEAIFTRAGAKGPQQGSATAAAEGRAEDASTGGEEGAADGPAEDAEGRGEDSIKGREEGAADGPAEDAEGREEGQPQEEGGEEDAAEGRDWRTQEDVPQRQPQEQQPQDQQPRDQPSQDQPHTSEPHQDQAPLPGQDDEETAVG